MLWRKRSIPPDEYKISKLEKRIDLIEDDTDNIRTFLNTRLVI